MLTLALPGAAAPATSAAGSVDLPIVATSVAGALIVSVSVAEVLAA